MRHQVGLEALETLRVTIGSPDPATRSLDIQWSLAGPSAIRLRFEYARLFLITPGGERVYLDIVDGPPTASVRLPATAPDGEYALEVDAYGSASWGDGRLEARGRSASFTLG
ncbi:hypothetical protein [Nocardia sp. NPDC050406]|uniref:hypothetical protein n=1 Tax=Nocardia sp. NPDC050406 TaxID=3364318 RepID=UPI0037A293D9